MNKAQGHLKACYWGEYATYQKHHKWHYILLFLKISGIIVSSSLKILGELDQLDLLKVIWYL